MSQHKTKSRPYGRLFYAIAPELLGSGSVGSNSSNVGSNSRSFNGNSGSFNGNSGSFNNSGGFNRSFFLLGASNQTQSDQSDEQELFHFLFTFCKRGLDTTKSAVESNLSTAGNLSSQAKRS